MTWIRWDCATPRSEVVGFLADRLGVAVVHALGYYNALCCGFGSDRQDGRIDQLTDTTLESWAMWDGKRGRFANAIREWCARPAQEDPDHDSGELRGWRRRQEALIRKQVADARKPDGRKGKSPANPAGDSRGILAGNGNGNENEDTTGSPLRSEPAVARAAAAGREVRPAVQVAVAANAGLRANPHLAGFNELLPHQAAVPVADWMAAGIPLPLICETVSAVARKFRPGPGRAQPTSFSYFDKPVREAHAKAQGTAELREAGTAPASRVPRIRRLV